MARRVDANGLCRAGQQSRRFLCRRGGIAIPPYKDLRERTLTGRFRRPKHWPALGLWQSFFIAIFWPTFRSAAVRIGRVAPRKRTALVPLPRREREGAFWKPRRCLS